MASLPGDGSGDRGRFYGHKDSKRAVAVRFLHSNHGRKASRVLLADETLNHTKSVSCMLIIFGSEGFARMFFFVLFFVAWCQG